MQQPTVNLGKLETSGIDFGFKYLLRDTAAGDFQFSLDATYIDKYDSTPCDICEVVHVAGTYNRQYGNYAKWRALASIGWALRSVHGDAVGSLHRRHRRCTTRTA